MLEQLRSTTQKSEYLGTVPVNCVVQAFNGCLAALGAFMRDITNSALSFAEFQSGAMATLDLKPKEIVMGAYTSIHCQELFVIPQFHRFDGKAPTAVSNAVSAHPAPSRKRPLFQPSGPPAVKLQRAYPSNPIPRTNHGRSAPFAARAPQSTGPNPPVRVVPPPALGNAQHQYICVSDFVSKQDAVRYSIGCLTPGCARRHTPLPAPGQFSAADKAELRQSLSRMKGTRVAPMTALIQSRN